MQSKYYGLQIFHMYEKNELNYFISYIFWELLKINVMLSKILNFLILHLFYEEL